MKNELTPEQTTQPEDNNGWIRVSEQLPKEGGRYLCHVEESNELGKSHFIWNCYFDDRDNEFRDSHQKMNVTHWQPLPEKPKF